MAQNDTFWTLPQKKPLIGQTQNGHFGSGQLEVSFAGGSKKCHFGPFKGAEILLLAPKPPFLGGFGPLQGQILYWDADFWPFLQSFGQIWTPRGSFGGPVLQSNRCPSTGFGWFWVAKWLTFGCVKRPELTRVLSKLFRFRIRARKLVLENWYVWPE